jgi:hypothetical protein
MSQTTSLVRSLFPPAEITSEATSLFSVKYPPPSAYKLFGPGDLQGEVKRCIVILLAFVKKQSNLILDTFTHTHVQFSPISKTFYQGLSYAAIDLLFPIDKGENLFLTPSAG